MMTSRVPMMMPRVAMEDGKSVERVVCAKKYHVCGLVPCDVFYYMARCLFYMGCITCDSQVTQADGCLDWAMTAMSCDVSEQTRAWRFDRDCHLFPTPP